MEGVVKGDVVVVPFPFTDLTISKKRPALCIASLQGDDVILCQITSKARSDSYSILLLKENFAEGNLSIDSHVRPNKIFTADKSLVLYKAGKIKNERC